MNTWLFLMPQLHSIYYNEAKPILGHIECPNDFVLSFGSSIIIIIKQVRWITLLSIEKKAKSIFIFKDVLLACRFVYLKSVFSSICPNAQFGFILAF